MSIGPSPRSRGSAAQTGWFFALHVGLPMLVGAFVYLAWRSPNLRVFDWLDAIGLSSAVKNLREVAGPLRRTLPRWAIYSLPDGLWVYAVASFMARVWRAGPRRSRLFWIAVGPALAIGWEMAQVVRVVPGTFDAMDLLLYGIGALAAHGFHGSALTAASSCRADAPETPIEHAEAAGLDGAT